jgi:hypothetical protein
MGILIYPPNTGDTQIQIGISKQNSQYYLSILAHLYKFKEDNVCAKHMGQS